MDLKSCKNKDYYLFFLTSELIKFSFKIIYNPTVGSIIGIQNKPLKGF